MLSIAARNSYAQGQTGGLSLVELHWEKATPKKITSSDGFQPLMTLSVAQTTQEW
jgi:hypothetical protein